MEIFWEWFFRILLFTSIAVLGVGIIAKIASWNRTPVPHRQILYPAPTTAAAANFKIGKELVLFQSAFLNDKVLWIGAVAFHFGLLGALGGHTLGIPTLGEIFAIFPGIDTDMSMVIADYMGAIFGIMLLFGLTILLIRRLSITEVKILTDPVDFFDLFFLIAIVIAGNWMRFFTDLEYIEARTFVIDLVTFNPVVLPRLSFLIHFTLALLFFMYFPFSKLMHFLGSVYTRYISTKPGKGMYQTDSVRLENTSTKNNKGV